jgi:hypothetical protein
MFGKKKSAEVERVSQDEVSAILELEVRMKRLEDLLKRLNPERHPLIEACLRGEK